MRRLVLGLPVVLVVAAIVAGVVRIRQRQEAQRRIAIWEAQRDEDANAPDLEESFDWEPYYDTLDGFAELVTAKTNINVTVDESGFIAEVNPNPTLRFVKVQVPRGTFTVQGLMKIVLEPHELCVEGRGRTLSITTAENAHTKSQLRTVVYPLPLSEMQELDDWEWASAVRWNLQGYVTSAPGALIVVANSEEQRRAKRVVDAVSKLTQSTVEPVEIYPTTRQSAAEQRIRAALEGPACLNAVEMPLRDVVRSLIEDHGIPIILSAHKLDEVSVSVDTPVTKNVCGLPLRSVLRLVLRDLELTYVVRDQALFITTPEDAENREKVVGYPVGDFAFTTEETPDVQLLSDVIGNCIAVDSWFDIGTGPNPNILIGDRWLIIRQTDEVHEQIQHLLLTLREMLAARSQAKTRPITPDSEAQRRIHAALDSAIELEFEQTPLKTVTRHIAEKLNIPIVLSVRKLEEAAVSIDTQISAKLPPQPVSVQLASILGPLQLDFVVRDEVLQITTPEDAESNLETRIYDVRELMAGGLKAERLKQLMCSHVENRSWFDMSGPGTVDTFYGLLVVTQTARVHEQVERFLETLRKQRAQGRAHIEAR